MAFRSMPYVFLLQILCFEKVYSLRCLSCDGISRPRNCDVVSTCAPGEVCYTKTIETHDGLKAFRLGCSKNVSHVCTDKAAEYQCSQCCDHELCNAEICGQPGYPVNRGPVCYSCGSRLQSQPCNIIDFCNDDEVCSLTEKKIFSDTVYTSGCSPTHICDLHSHHSGIIVGRSAVVPNLFPPEDDLTPGNYQRCCKSDLCNSYHDCESSPCFNGGTCVDMVHDYACTCQNGYTGRNCDLDINECRPINPCLNGGTCTDEVNGFHCYCQPGYDGRNCSKDINECRPINPCLNGGTCTDEVNGFHCYCQPGYDGRNCSKDINECRPINPCLNGGTCTDEVNGFHCYCQPGYDGRNCSKVYARDCLEVLDSGIGNSSGVYTIMVPYINTTLQVLCDMTTDGGGWTTFQYRFNGSVDFYRNFSEYEYGFGDIHGEFWLGLLYIRALTMCQEVVLRIDLETSNGRTAYETFGNFTLSSTPSYRLSIDNGTGTAGDSPGLSYHNGSAFVTYDRDDADGCAARDHGAWWYRDCAYANLNGLYVKPPGKEAHSYREAGMLYHPLDGDKSLKSTKMSLRRRERLYKC